MVFMQNVQESLPNIYQKSDGGLPTVYQDKIHSINVLSTEIERETE